MLNRALTAVYDRALAPHELKVSQFNLLVAIETHPGVCAAELGGALCIDESTLSRNLERLRARGWLEVEPGEDSRVRSLRLTASGRSAFEAASLAWVEAQDEATRLLGSTGAAALGRLAGRFLGK